MKGHAALNRIYRLVWSQTRNAWVAVAETSSGRCKAAGCKRVASAALAATLATCVGLVQAAPVGGVVTAGSGSVAQSGDTTTITQTSQNLSMNWTGFNTTPSETVNFVQPSASAIAVNRIFDTNGTQFLGRLNANGQVYLINPNGILFGPGAQVNVGALVASTLDFNDSSLSQVARTFSGNGSGSVVNQGTINGRYVALLGNTVSNQGTITSELGTVALGAGSAVTLTFADTSLVKMQVDQSTLNNLAENGGLIRADGGMVLLHAGAKNALLASVVNNTGVIEARTVQAHEGSIVLLGGMAAGTVNVDGRLDASAPNGGNGGFIETSAASVKVADSARITTAAVDGSSGTWLIDPVDFTIAASGGDMTGATLGTNLGSGNVIIQSSSGASGTAGNVNVNDVVSWSANKLTLNAQNNININANLNGSGTASLALEYGQGAVASGNTSDYIVKAKINLAAGANKFSTKLGSDGTAKNYTVITSLGAAGSTTKTDLQGINGDLNLNYALGADIDATATSGWNSGAGFNPLGTSSSGFKGTFTGLGHTISNLTINRTSTDYVGLFGKLDGGSVVRNAGLVGGSVSGSLYVGALVGVADGAVSNSYASTTVSGANRVGGLIGQAANPLSNSYATGNVTGSGDYIGGLVGYNYTAAISNSYATGNVNGANRVGGLAGINYRGAISTSYATGSVTGSVDYVGGLVGSGNNSSDSITTSYATGSVSGVNRVGGLVGSGYGTISKSYATGSVTGSGNTIGGLIGHSDATISNSYATGSISGGNNVGGFVGLHFTGSISTTYATGSVTGSGSHVGGLEGFVDEASPATNSYWDTQTSGQATSAGGTGRTTAQMKQQSNFSGFDFTNDWILYAGQTTPLLRNFMTALTVTANNASKTSDGAAYAGGNGVSYSVTPNGNLLGSVSYSGTSQGATSVGTYVITPGGLYSSQQGYIISYANGTLTVNAAAATSTRSGSATKKVDTTVVLQPLSANVQIASSRLTNQVGVSSQTAQGPATTQADASGSVTSPSLFDNALVTLDGTLLPVKVVNGGIKMPDAISSFN